jgi:HPt (histidine-containing phosphotransfer) domain-containing protein
VLAVSQGVNGLYIFASIAGGFATALIVAGGIARFFWKRFEKAVDEKGNALAQELVGSFASDISDIKNQVIGNGGHTLTLADTVQRIEDKSDEAARLASSAAKSASTAADQLVQVAQRLEDHVLVDETLHATFMRFMDGQ